MIQDYYANFCDSGHCFNAMHRCTYPVRKKALLENIYDAQITGQITKIKVEVDCRDKFHIKYPDNTNWKCSLYIHNEQICSFEVPTTSNVLTVNYEWIDPTFIKYFQNGLPEIECELYIGNDIACPYALSLIIYTMEE